MARTNQAYPPEFRQQMVELVKSGEGRTSWLGSTSRRRGPSATGWPRMNATEGSAATVRAPTSAWSCGGCGASTSSCELSVTSKNERRLGSHGRATRSPGGIRVREGESGRLAGAHPVSGAGNSPPAATTHGYVQVRRHERDGTRSYRSGSRRSGAPTARCTGGRASTPSCRRTASGSARSESGG